VHTLHGPFVADTYEFYAHHAAKAAVVAISAAQLGDGPPNLRSAGVIPNPLDVSEWSLRTDKDEFLLWIGRINPDKGPHRAIEAARASGRPLILAGPVQPGNERFFAEHVQPQLDGDAIQWIGEVGGQRKRELFERAAALLMPIRWPEPFGMVMAEALACGTPVVAFPEGSAPEIVDDGRTGFVVGDERQMAEAVGRLDTIDPRACRAWVEEHCSIPAVAERYEQAYRATVELDLRTAA
jgi:glycosyltransferase involved in cell wall biosynthesis